MNESCDNFTSCARKKFSDSDNYDNDSNNNTTIQSPSITNKSQLSLPSTPISFSLNTGLVTNTPLSGTAKVVSADSENGMIESLQNPPAQPIPKLTQIETSQIAKSISQFAKSKVSGNTQ